ncbi:MAG: DUF1080 domain-containing protein, partial [Sedimentisphaerales bacterium]|nr:DUF1080 domain-containing protein [Sedimentisphaerales bacterium]
MNTRMSAVIVFLVMFFGLAPAFAAPYTLIGDNFLRVGKVWDYDLVVTVPAEGDGQEQLFGISLMEIVATASVNGYEAFTIENSFTIDENTESETSTWAFDDGFLLHLGWQDAQGSQQFRDGDPLEFFPVVIEDSYNNELIGHGLYEGQDFGDPNSGWIGSEEMKITFVGIDTITVPLGTFDCIVVDMLQEWQDDPGVFYGHSEARRWIAPHVGIIKEQVDEYEYNEDSQTEEWYFSYERELAALQGNLPIHVDPAAPAEGDGFSWTTALRSMGEALLNAYEGDEIWVKQGTYLLNQALLVDGEVAIYGGFIATETARDQRQTDSELTILDGQDTATHCLIIEADAILDSFTITGGNANGSELDDQMGGGILVLQANPTVKNCRIIENAAVFGGGIYNNSAMKIYDSTIADNTAQDGGGVYNDGGYASLGVIRCIIVGNEATGLGGGVYCNGSSTSLNRMYPEFSNCVIMANVAETGGGFYFGQYVTPDIYNCTVVFNQAEVGGGMFIAPIACYPVLFNTLLRENEADEFDFQWDEALSESRPENLQLVYCDIRNLQALRDYTSWPSGSINFDIGNLDISPGFIDDDGPDDDPATWQDNNLQLASDSPVIDMGKGREGSYLAPKEDILGVVRPQGLQHDMGAYEFVAIDEVASIGVDTEQLDFGFYKSMLELDIWNDGEGTLEFNVSITEGDDYFSAACSGTSTGPADRNICEVVLDRTMLAPGQTISGTLMISGTADDSPKLISLSAQALPVPDVNGDKSVGLTDLLMLADNWLRNDCSIDNDFCSGVDFDQDSMVNLMDFALLGQYWQYSETVVVELPFEENYDDDNFDGWTVVDQGDQLAPSTWGVYGGIVYQTSHIYSTPTAPSTLAKPGTFLRFDAGFEWTDYMFTCDVRSRGYNDLGLMFRVQDNDNYYRFSWNSQAEYARLVKVVNGVATLLDEESQGYIRDQVYTIKIIASGEMLKVYADDVLLLEAADSTFDAGTIALYTWGNAPVTYFDNILVEPYESLLVDSFSDGDYNGWTVHDTGDQLAPSVWGVFGGILYQTSHIYSNPTSPETLLKDGTYLG